ncbi:MAG TPA: hypothetical protein VJ866_17440 [Pyrinomonadaceae bacterium]|nr:hypothetical protein [Pyrinomonadaceae bacterium]
MRRRTFLLAAGLLAYFIGATVRVYLRYPACSDREFGCRAAVVAAYPRAALRQPVMALEYLVFSAHVE